MKILRTLVITMVLGLSPTISMAQGAGVCNRASDDTRSRIVSDVQLWKDAINSADYPAAVKQAHNILFDYNMGESLRKIEGERVACTAAFKPYQDVVDAMVAIYTGGLSEILAPHMTHVDVSELLAGYPLGGPNALVPKFREDILRGDRGTVANIIRDPWKCLTFQRKC